jgi:DNA oxidative demethylase
MRTTPTARRSGARSRRGGQPTSLPPAGTPTGGPPVHRQLSLPVAGDATDPTDATDPAAPAVGADGADGDESRAPREVLPGVVHVPRWLDLPAQQELVEQFRTWARPPAGLRHPRVPTGHLMSVQSVCLGWHWYPYVYSRTADDTDGAPVKPLPAGLRQLGREAVGVTMGEAPGTAYEPDAAILNFYAPDARLGLHQDGEEPSDAPVVTISIGDTCTFRLAGVDRRTGPFVDLALRSGDLLVFGGPNRRIYHGVPKVFPGTAPDGVGLPPGRLSVTLRETGLS